MPIYHNHDAIPNIVEIGKLSPSLDSGQLVGIVLAPTVLASNNNNIIKLTKSHICHSKPNAIDYCMER